MKATQEELLRASGWKPLAGLWADPVTPAEGGRVHHPLRMAIALQLERASKAGVTVMITGVGMPLHFEAQQSKTHPAEWVVEAIDHASEGEIYAALFSGRGAANRATEYAEWKNR